MRVLCVVVVAAFLAACSGQPKVVNSSKSPAEAQADYDECRGNAAVTIALIPQGKNVDDLRQKAIDECMKSKGYNVK